jgi:serine/threonine-protein kinase
MYELLSGSPPFIATDDFELISAHLHEPPPSFSAPIAATTPAEVTAVVERALAKDPDERFADAGAMATAIEDAAPHL